MKKILLLLLLTGLIQPLLAQNASVDSLELICPVSGSPEDLISGKVSGLWVSRTDGNPSSAQLTLIRGISSLRGESNPLWVVDGAVLTDTEAQRVDSFFRDEYAPYQHTSRLNGLSYLNLYDIERIEILKDATATALYGSKGANGVILVTTRSAGDNPLDIKWNSNFGMEVSSGGLSPSFCHNHNIAVHFKSKNAGYSLSAFWRDNNHPVPGADDKMGGIRLKFNTMSNPYVWFGFNTAISVGKQSSMIADYNGFWEDHDDINNAFRTTFDTFLRINFFPFFYWETRAGLDAKNDSRNHWEGLGNPFGATKNRAGAFSVSSTMRYNIASSLIYDGHITENHRLRAEVAIVYDGDNNRCEINAADNFMTDALRGKGMDFRESVTHPFWLKYSLSEFGAYGSLKYSFKDFFELSALFRADNCSRYDDNNYSLYPSASAKVDLQRIMFPKSKAVSALSIDGGYGVVGLRRYVPYAALLRFMSPLELSNALATKGIVVDVNTPQDDRSSFIDGYARTMTNEWHVGLDITFLSGRIHFSGRWYDRKSDDRFNLYTFGKQSSSSLYAWTKAPREDIFQDSDILMNKGLELDLDAVLLQKDKFKWTLSGNFSYNDWSGTSLLSFNPLPKYLSGIGTRFSYSGFTAELYGRGAWGHQICNLDKMYNESIVDELSCLEGAGYFSLSSAALTYEFSIKSVKFIKSIAASLTAANLLTVSRYSGKTPDVNSYAFLGGSSLGYDSCSLPPATTLMMGIMVRF